MKLTFFPFFGLGALSLLMCACNSQPPRRLSDKFPSQQKLAFKAQDEIRARLVQTGRIQDGDKALLYKQAYSSDSLISLRALVVLNMMYGKAQIGKAEITDLIYNLAVKSEPSLTWSYVSLYPDKGFSELRSDTYLLKLQEARSLQAESNQSNAEETLNAREMSFIEKSMSNQLDDIQFLTTRVFVGKRGLPAEELRFILNKIDKVTNQSGLDKKDYWLFIKKVVLKRNSAR